jgi:hypothetical protein
MEYGEEGSNPSFNTFYMQTISIDIKRTTQQNAVIFVFAITSTITKDLKNRIITLLKEHYIKCNTNEVNQLEFYHIISSRIDRSSETNGNRDRILTTDTIANISYILEQLKLKINYNIV